MNTNPYVTKLFSLPDTLDKYREQIKKYTDEANYSAATLLAYDTLTLSNYEGDKLILDELLKKKWIKMTISGSLGKKLFQIAALFGYLEKFKDRDYYPLIELRRHIPPPSETTDLWLYFIRNINLANIAHVNGKTTAVIMSDDQAPGVWSDVDIAKDCDYNIECKGNFQSEYYFYNASLKVFDHFKPSNEIAEKIFSKYDLKNKMFIHYKKDVGVDFYLRCIEYTQLIDPEIKYIVCCADSDMEECKSLLNKFKSRCESRGEELHGDSFQLLQNENEVVTLWIIMLCDRGGISTSTSSFGWWGLWMNSVVSVLHNKKRMWIVDDAIKDSTKLMNNYISSRFTVIPRVLPVATTPGVAGSESNSELIPSYFINLDKRSDRWENLQALFEVCATKSVLKPIRFSAVDGKELEWNDEYKTLFRRDEKFVALNPYYFIKEYLYKGEIGCALSHYNAWKHIANLPNGEVVGVFEDDIYFNIGFSDRIRELKKWMLDSKELDIVFLGSNNKPLHNEIITSFASASSGGSTTRVIKFDDRIRTQGAGAYSYLITPEGASKLLMCIEKYGIPQPVDWFMMSLVNEVNIGLIQPHIVCSYMTHREGDKGDSDVQRDSDNFLELTFVKLLTNWTSSQDLVDKYKRFSMDGKGRWNNIQIVTEDEEADYTVIINHPRPDAKITHDSLHTIVLRMEPDVFSVNFGMFIDPDPRFFKAVNIPKYTHTSIEWQLTPTWYDFVTNNNVNLTKTKTISYVISELYILEGHKFRVDFVKYLQNSGLLPELELWGRSNNNNFKNHNGPLPEYEKDKGLMPYKYYISIENCAQRNYFSEKINEPFLCECLPFYWGCTNLEEYYHPLSFIRLDSTSFENSYKIIRNAIDNNEYEKRLPYIKESKRRILHEIGFFPELEKILKKP